MKCKIFIQVVLIIVFLFPNNSFSSQWTAMSSGTTQILDGIWGSSGSDVFAVGSGGTILHYDGSGWTPMTSGITTYLYGVWGGSSNDVFTVGDGGTILHYSNVTLITLSSFTAIPSDRQVTLEWTTESEIDNAGFNLYRSEVENGNYSKINSSLIPAKGSSTQGAAYGFDDNNVQNRKTYYYKLEDIDLNGTSTMHGPVKATPRLIFRIGK